MNTQENNKMIAEFMDYTHVLLPVSVGLEYYDGDEMEYYTSWNWLMPVVKECFKTGDDTHEWDNIMDTLFTCDREIVYAQVVEFIKQYNESTD